MASGWNLKLQIAPKAEDTFDRKSYRFYMVLLERFLTSPCREDIDGFHPFFGSAVVDQNIHKLSSEIRLVDHFNDWMLYERTSHWVIDFPTFSGTHGSTAMATCNALRYREGFLCLDIMWKSNLRCSSAEQNCGAVSWNDKEIVSVWS